ncbi:MAG: hypothetical protein J7549_01610 [Variovorax sp.]|nr:hypothetical protein [Variovorax sp.]
MSDTHAPPPPSRVGPGNEEPEIAFEESIPLDGPDPVGERMIEELGADRRASRDAPPPADGEPMPEQFPAS